MLKAVIFDMDGTICDTLPLCIEAFRRAVEPLYGKQLSDEEIVASFGPSEEGTIKALIPGHFEKGVSDFLSHYRSLHSICPTPFEGILEIIDNLKERGIIVALVTGKGEKSCRLTLDYYGINDRFDMVETGHASGPCKPEGIGRVLDQFGLKAKEAIYVGDAPGDIIAAREVGMPIISALWGSFISPEEIKILRPDRICRSIEELSFTLEELIGIT